MLYGLFDLLSKMEHPGARLDPPVSLQSACASAERQQGARRRSLDLHIGAGARVHHHRGASSDQSDFEPAVRRIRRWAAIHFVFVVAF